MKPEFHAEWVVSSKELWISASCFFESDKQKFSLMWV